MKRIIFKPAEPMYYGPIRKRGGREYMRSQETYGTPYSKVGLDGVWGIGYRHMRDLYNFEHYFENINKLYEKNN